MIVIVSDRKRISRADVTRMTACVEKSSGEDCIGILVNDYADAIRVFTLDTAKTITVDELRELLHPHTNGTE